MALQPGVLGKVTLCHHTCTAQHPPLGPSTILSWWLTRVHTGKGEDMGPGQPSGWRTTLLQQ